jgi:hypothetical protein
MVRQHDSTGAHSNGLRPTGHVSDYDSRRGTGNTRHVVMFCQPQSVVSPALGVLRKIERIA